MRILIPREDVVITITHTGYIKRLPVTTYRSQKRGGRGVVGMDTKEDDFVEHLFVTNTHQYLLFFTNKGKAYRIKAYEVPELGRTARGTPVINLIQIEPGEIINAVIPVKDFDSDQLPVLCYSQRHREEDAACGLCQYSQGRADRDSSWEEDELIGVKLTDGKQEIIMGTANGMSIRFSEEDVRSMGRSATGVKGISIGDRR